MVEHALSHPLWFANNVMKRDAFKVVLVFLFKVVCKYDEEGTYICMLLILCNKCVFCPTWLGCVLQAVNRAQIVPPLGIYYFTKIAIFCIDIKFLFVRKWHQPSLSRWPTNCFLDELLSSKHVKPFFISCLKYLESNWTVILLGWSWSTNWLPQRSFAP